MTTFKNMTGYEIDSLAQTYNLTDGHAFRPWTDAEQAIIGRSAELFFQNDRRMQAKLETAYIRDFLYLGRQSYRPNDVGFLMCFTASMAFEIVANYLRLNQLSLCLIEPCFDNLADIFKRHDLELEPFPDAMLEADIDTFDAFLDTISADVICLVTPNNPTGTVLSQENTILLIEYCKTHDKLLILDNCFRAYQPRYDLFDQYALILDADIDCIMIEDTGKTWPTVEIKAPFFGITKARGLFDSFYDIYTDFLLHISPVGVKLVHEFVRLSCRDEMAAIHALTRRNRETLYRALAGTFLMPVGKPFASMAWLRIENGMTGFELKEILDARGVFVLPGAYFYWRDKSRGAHYIRIALSREPQIVAAAAKIIRETCLEIEAQASALRPKITRCDLLALMAVA